MKNYKAPWGASLIALSALGTLILCGVVALILTAGGGELPGWLVVLPLAIVGGSALFTIRGYSITSDAILIHRLFWSTRLSLADLQSAEFEPGVMGWCFRTFGNGGLFSFSGFFRSNALGAYRAFVTDPHRAVVLRYPSRIVVVSPAAPEDFVRALGGAGAGPAHARPGAA